MAKKIETKEDEINELEKIEEEFEEKIEEEEAKVEKKKGKKKKSEDDGAESEEKSEEQEETLEKEDSKEPSENEDEKSQNADEESLEEKIKKKKQKEIDQYNFQFVKEEKKIIVDENITEIKNLLDDKKVIGTKEVMHYLKKNKIKKIFVTKNAPKQVLLEMEHIAKLADAQLVYLKHTNNELGIVCRKPFGISLLGVIK